MSISEKILISACLLGQQVRYDGKDNAVINTVIDRWQKEGCLISVCPEVSGGLPVPRPAAEIVNATAIDIIKSANEPDYNGQVKISNGENVTLFFIEGANYALQLCKKHNIKLAILKQNSPSCGSTQVYDGSFDAKLVPGMGITTALLRQHGIKVFGEDEIEAAEEYYEPKL